LTENKDRQTWD